MNKKRWTMMASALVAMMISSGVIYADGGSISYGEGNRSVTIWAVVINYPEACSSIPCTEADIFGSLPANPTKAAVCYITGQVVRHDGKAVFAGRLAEGSNHGCFFPDDPNPFGMKDSMRAELHAVAQEHGKTLPSKGGREEQVAMFMGACNPGCVDTQFATHVAADAMDGVSWSYIYRFADESMVSRARSTLYRDRNGIRLLFDTRFDPMD